LEYAVKAETFQGKVMILRRGFSTAEAAEDHPVQMSLWKRVWVEPMPEPAPEPPAVLPPMPWTADIVDCYGGKTNFTYIRDANGRRIMSLLGRPGEKEKMAEFICAASRSQS
jgi:hypothetical protein